MDRRKNIKAILLGGMSIPFMQGCLSKTKEVKHPEITKETTNQESTYESNWHTLPDMPWPGPDYWANRLQDWTIKDGKLECLFQGKNRTVHCLTRQLGSSRNRFKMRMSLYLSPDLPAAENNLTGFLLGAKSTFRDYRAAAIKGKGLKAGINALGCLFIGNKVQPDPVASPEQLHKGIILEVLAEPLGMKYALRLTAFDSGEKVLGQWEESNVAPVALEGNVGIIIDINTVKEENSVACSIEKWTMSGKKFKTNPSGALGPVCFTQYTQHQGVVKLTAQMMPVALPATAFLEIKENSSWEKVAHADIDYPSYTARFRLTGWKHQKPVPYRVGVDLKGGDRNTGRYYYEGTIAEEPLKRKELRALVCSCNFDYGFPDQEVVDYASVHNPDLIMFLGDQFYEPNGGFGIQRAPLEKAYLDYLRKWYQFGWSYRELFRHRPVINLPDDHDVFQANLFGAGGKKVPSQTSQRFKRDLGGFIMPPEWVNMVMTTQTSHMPDPYDPAPIRQGIHVFYTDWKYAGVSFGIIEDRKFKSGPAAILPEEARVRDAFIMNDAYDASRHSYPDASLVGDRQLRFLKEWIEDWGQDTTFKVLVSATPFHALQTLPEGADSNGDQRRLKVPETGEYIKGDVPVADMDSGGWPQSQRDDLLRVTRKAFVVHLAGDQHLPSVTQYGVDDWGDAGIAFAVPALGNSWPRRWWPPIPVGHQPLPGRPPYTGNHTDAFGNKMRVMAVANPHRTRLEPDYLYDRSTGYGLVTFNKEAREVKMECWPRYANPLAEPDSQFGDWPLTIKQQDNFNPANPHYLPALTVEGTNDPVIKVVDEHSGELVHILRIQGNTYQARVQGAGAYTVVVHDTQRGIIKKVAGLRAGLSRDKKQTVVL